MVLELKKKTWGVYSLKVLQQKMMVMVLDYSAVLTTLQKWEAVLKLRVMEREKGLHLS